MRQTKTFSISGDKIRERLLAWSAKQDMCCVLNCNNAQQLFADQYSAYDIVVAAGQIGEPKKSFDELKNVQDKNEDWLFGFFTYDLKNELENLSSKNFDGLNFPELYFFQPRWVIFIEDGELKIEYSEAHNNHLTIEQIAIEIFETEISDADEKFEINIQSWVSKAEYILTVNKIKEHIQRGDIYEMNYCVEFFSDQAEINPVEIYLQLNELSPMPFSAFVKIENKYAICASPERFLAKRAGKIISQPIKGTSSRGKTPIEDEEKKLLLKNDLKEQSENVMIVDLVRNDLSRTAKKRSVQVEELFGISTFKQLHQMVSTVVSEKKDKINSVDVISSAFPMGSMTGAPKVRAMQLIEQFEKTKRGLYSGSIGYFNPQGDFDFNVVIRTILYAEEKKYLSFMVGSAITINADVEKEYAECLLKAKAMMQVLENKKVVAND